MASYGWCVMDRARASAFTVINHVAGTWKLGLVIKNEILCLHMSRFWVMGSCKMHFPIELGLNRQKVENDLCSSPNIEKKRKNHSSENCLPKRFWVRFSWCKKLSKSRALEHQFPHWFDWVPRDAVVLAPVLVGRQARSEAVKIPTMKIPSTRVFCG